MIGIVDLGMGNLESVRKAFAILDLDARRVNTPAEIGACDRLVLPGVGAFGQAMESLQNLDLRAPLDRYVESGRPILGICLGMQLMLDSSCEHGHHAGLGWIRGDVRRFDSSVRIPHIGWNTITRAEQARLFEGIPQSAHFYFVQSFYVKPIDASVVSGRTDYGISFAAAIESGNLFGVQFHPEKSQREGLRLLANFGRLPCS